MNNYSFELYLPSDYCEDAALFYARMYIDFDDVYAPYEIRILNQAHNIYKNQIRWKFKAIFI